MTDYPEHDKLLAIKDETQAAGDFIEWLGSQGVFLAKNYMFDEHLQRTDDAAQCFTERILAYSRSLTELLADWQGIDLAKIEAEKRQMLASLRTG
jgi:hypothetical protein